LVITLRPYRYDLCYVQITLLFLSCSTSLPLLHQL